MMQINKQKFGTLSDGREVLLFTIDNGKMRMSLTNYGACITSILLPAKNGIGFDDIVLGYSTLAGYIDNKHHFGSLLGRVAGRISNAKVKIGDEEYHLAQNDGKNCLHGGYPSYDKQIWHATQNSTADNATIFLERYSNSGEQGFPGGLQMLVSYTLTRDNEIILRYYAKTDEPTFVNLTNHTYFNLNPAGMQAGGNYVSILNHELLIPSEEYIETNTNLIPTGKILPVKNSNYDFTAPRILSDAINDKNTSGLDTTFIIKKNLDSYKALACVLHEPVTERILRVYSTQPALTVYTGNFLDRQLGKNGNLYDKFAGICLESQGYPDSPNQKNFPSILLKPEQIYNQETVWYFTF
ncbi:MAG: galactose mutarotase [Treponemataceae bacterium]